MDLTADLVALCEREVEDPGPDPRWELMDEADHAAMAERLLAELGGDPFWVFAYGSLIWNPTYAHVEHRLGTIHGWHRSFCLELTRWRGSREIPGLMMALDRGGSCTGIAYRLPDAGHREMMLDLVTREIVRRKDRAMVRWVTVRTADGPVRALLFWAGPDGPGISLKLDLERVAETLARACGHGGSGAAYLHNTVAALDQVGLRDRNLWTLQSLVAREIRRHHGLAEE